MPLTVLSVAHPFAPVGVDAVGGAEQVLAQLDAALVEAGQRSLVIACEGSAVRGQLLALPTVAGAIDDAAYWHLAGALKQRLAEALDRWPVDLVHMHGFTFHQFLPPAGVPVLGTLHLPPHTYDPAVFSLRRPRTYLNCVSAAQQRACPAAHNLLPYIANGIPLARFGARVRKRRYALALGRICPEKGFHLALEAAARAGLDAVLAGQVFAYREHQAYFREHIAPRLDGRRRFIGPVGLDRKRRLLAGAACLAAPSLLPETSSLVAMEALASGTPVVAFPAGSLADLVEPGVTGYLVDDVDGMAGALRAAERLDPDACRAAAHARFAVERMTHAYLALYRALARGEAQPLPVAPGVPAQPAELAEVTH